MSTSVEDLKKAIATAEASVADIQSPDLKKTAFETVLASLLNAASDSSVQAGASLSIRSKPASGSRRNAKKSSVKQPGVPRVSPREEKKSQLELNEKQLQELKTFYESIKPSGSEEMVFALARFADEKLSTSEFHEGDILTLCNDLLSVKPAHQPMVMDIDSVKRALSWLTSPSRKKSWLKKLENGSYSISPKGRHKIIYGSESSKSSQ